MLCDDLDLKPERVVESNRVRRVEQRRLTPRLVQFALRRRQDQVATLAVASMPWPGFLRVQLLRVDAVAGIGETASKQRVEAQLVQRIDPVRGLLLVQPRGFGGKRFLQCVGDVCDGEPYSSTSSPLTTSLIFGAAWAWNSPALSWRMYRW